MPSPALNSAWRLNALISSTRALALLNRILPRNEEDDQNPIVEDTDMQQEQQEQHEQHEQQEQQQKQQDPPLEDIISTLGRIYVVSAHKLGGPPGNMSSQKYATIRRLLCRLATTKAGTLALKELEANQFLLPPHPMWKDTKRPIHKRSRYMRLLFSTPADRVSANEHPVKDALQRTRESYKKSTWVYTLDSQEEEEEPVDQPRKTFLHRRLGIRRSASSDQSRRKGWTSTLLPGKKKSKMSRIVRAPLWSPEQRQSYQPKETMFNDIYLLALARDSFFPPTLPPTSAFVRHATPKENSHVSMPQKLPVSHVGPIPPRSLSKAMPVTPTTMSNANNDILPLYLLRGNITKTARSQALSKQRTQSCPAPKNFPRLPERSLYLDATFAHRIPPSLVKF